MRVLLANKFFRPGAGAETAFFTTRDLLLGAGHEVLDFAMSSERNLTSPTAGYFAPPRDYSGGQPHARRIVDAGASIYSVAARRAIRRLVRDHRPDVAHLHNVYHQLSLSIVDELVAQDVPIVMTLHDYKIVCPAYTLYTEGAPCRRCVGHVPAHAVVHKCIKRSVVASSVGAVESVLARTRGIYRKIDAIVSPSRFLADLASTYAEPKRIFVLPNCLPITRAGERPPVEQRERTILFAGRLEPVKGIRPLLDAFARVSTPQIGLVIAGDGPLRGEVESAARRDARIRYVGEVSREEVHRLLSCATAMVLPSLWEENCPMIILEARAAGTPVICASTGGLPELVSHGRDGIVVHADDPESIRSGVERLVDDPSMQERLARQGLLRLARDHDPSSYLARLLEIYQRAAHRHVQR